MQSVDPHKNLIEFTNTISNRIWCVNIFNESYLNSLSKEFNIDKTYLNILINRSVDENEFKNITDLTIKNNLPDPHILEDMELASNRVCQAIINKEVIGIIGDYDVDGITSASILYDFLLNNDLVVVVRIPDRFKDGYGPNENLINNLKEFGVDLIITVDCGSNSHEIIKNFPDIDFIIFDHHQTDNTNELGAINVNPNRNDDNSNLGYLSAAGVVFLAVISINRMLKEIAIEHYEMHKIDLLKYLPLTALATVADIVPLQKLNRAIIKQGLALYKKYKNLGLETIISKLKSSDEITSSDLGYLIGPRINAGGRMGQSKLGFELLTSNSKDICENISNQLEELNSKRIAIENNNTEEAVSQYEDMEKKNNIIILSSESWHVGVIGLIASRISSRYNKTTCVLTPVNKDDNVMTGSARSVGDINIGKAIEEAVLNGILISGGGHSMAAGFKISKNKLMEFHRYLSEDKFKIESKRKIVMVDGLLMSSAVNTDYVKGLLEFGPYGNGFEEPKFIFPKHKIIGLSVLKNQHLKFKIQDDNGFNLEAISFRSFDMPLGKFIIENSYQRMDFLGKLSLNQWLNKITPQIIIEDAALNK